MAKVGKDGNSAGAWLLSVVRGQLSVVKKMLSVVFCTRKGDDNATQGHQGEDWF